MARPPKPLSLEDVPGGPEPGETIAAAGDIAEGQALLLSFSEGAQQFEAFLIRHQGRIIGYHNRCPHRALPLTGASGAIFDDTGKRLVCPHHQAYFEPATGLCTEGPCRKLYLRPIAITEQDGAIVAL